MRILSILLIFAVAFGDTKETLQQLMGFQKAVNCARTWAPIVRLHPKEKYMPYSVENYLLYVRPWRKDMANPTNSLPQGELSKDFYLITKTDKDQLLQDPDSFLYGINPSRHAVPAYAAITPCDQTYDRFVVTYWLFFAFNQGKAMCSVRLPYMAVGLPMIRLFNMLCHGRVAYYGSHIGDWERVTLEFKDSIPARMHLSVHSVTVEYMFDSETDTFYLVRGLAKGMTQVQNPPSRIFIGLRGRPILYSALGSHALYAGAGTHEYTRLRLRQLSDETAEGGSQWDTSSALRVFSAVGDPPAWYTYGGLWGNPKCECTHVLTYFGGSRVCVFGDGPRGLGVRKPDVQCAEPNPPK